MTLDPSRRRFRALPSVAAAITILAGAVPAQIDWNVIALSGGPPQSLAGYAYDAPRDRLVLFGGQQSSFVYDTTWEWNGTAWQQQFPTTRPPACTRPAMVYDAARQVVISFGGVTSSNGFLNDTWEWNGTSWRRLLPAGVPPVRSAAALAYDTVRRVVVMFGGFVPSGQDTNDVWEWDGTTWTQRIPTTSPRARGAHRMAYDQARRVTVLYGGYSTLLQSTLSDTWTWDGNGWTNVSNTGPGSRCDQTMDYDVARSRVVLFGGLRISGPSQLELGDTYDWDGSSWTIRTTTSRPTNRAYGHGVFDSARSRIVMFGGRRGTLTLGDTWEFKPNSPATLTPYGSGCTGTAGVPALASLPGQLPWLSDTFDLSLTNLGPNVTQAFLLFGISDTMWGANNLPFDLTQAGVNGCTLYTSIEASAGYPAAAGSAVLTGIVCGCPTALGLPFYMQAVVLDPGATRPVQATLSNAMKGVVGGR